MTSWKKILGLLLAMMMLLSVAMADTATPTDLETKEEETYFAVEEIDEVPAEEEAPVVEETEPALDEKGEEEGEVLDVDDSEFTGKGCTVHEFLCYTTTPTRLQCRLCRIYYSYAKATELMSDGDAVKVHLVDCQALSACVRCNKTSLSSAAQAAADKKHHVACTDYDKATETGDCSECGETSVEVAWEEVEHSHSLCADPGRCVDCHEKVTGIEIQDDDFQYHVDPANNAKHYYGCTCGNKKDDSYYGNHARPCDDDEADKCVHCQAPLKSTYTVLTSHTFSNSFTASSDPNYHEAECDACGETIKLPHKAKYEWDEAKHWGKCIECGEQVAEAPHVVNCQSKKNCVVCKATGILANTYSHLRVGKTYKYDETDHWNLCLDCGRKVDSTVEKHTWDANDYCEVCGVYAIPVTEIIPNQSKFYIMLGEKNWKISFTTVGGDGKDKFTYTVEDGSILSVASTGVITAKKVGNTYVTISINKVTAKVLVYVVNPSIKLTSRKTVYMLKGTYRQLVANLGTSLPVSGKIIWSAKVPTVVSVTNGLVYGKKAGLSRVYCKTPAGKVDSLDVVVQDPTVAFYRGKTKLTTLVLKVNGGANLTAKLVANPKNYSFPSSLAAQVSKTWSSSNTSVLKVTSTGAVTGLKKGVAYVRVKLSTGRTCSLKVIVQ